MELRIPSILIPKGDQQCNICGVKTRLWLSRGHNNEATEKYDIIGGKKRKVNCPHCGSSDRDRLLKYFFEDLSPFGSLLHVAPEKALSHFFKSQGDLNIFRIDKKVGWYKLVYGNDVKDGDLTKLSFPDANFDWVIANHVLEHIEDEDRAINEIHRVLKPNGKAILQIPFSYKLKLSIEGESHWNQREKEEKLGQKDHVRLYGIDFPKRWGKFQVNLLFLTDKNNYKRYNLNPNEPVILLTKNIISEKMQHFNSLSFEEIV